VFLPGVSLNDYDAADNVDLLIIMQEYEKYFEDKYGRRVKFFRKPYEGEEKETPAAPGGKGGDKTAGKAGKPSTKPK
jgi:hypothetical protein